MVMILVRAVKRLSGSRRDDCTPAAVWSALKMESTKRESRLELLDDGRSSTPGGSTELGGDIDSSSVTTSSSSDASGTAAAARDGGVGLGARPKQRLSAGGLHLNLEPFGRLELIRPTETKRERAARDNDGFVRDEVTARTQHQRQLPQPPPTKADNHYDSRTQQCVSVELHSAPLELDGPERGETTI